MYVRMLEFSSVYLCQCRHHNYDSWNLRTWCKARKPFVHFSAMWLMKIQAQKAWVAVNSHWECTYEIGLGVRDKWNWNYFSYYISLDFCSLLLFLHPHLLLAGTGRGKEKKRSVRICFLKGIVFASPCALHYEYFPKSCYTCKALKYSLLVSLLPHKEPYQSSGSRLRLSPLSSSFLVTHVPI